MRSLTGKEVLTECVILEIIRKEMTLEESQTWVGDTNTKIPPDTRLYVVARMVDAQPISSESQFIPENDDGNPAELQQYIVCENIQIDIFLAILTYSPGGGRLSALFPLYTQNKNKRNTVLKYSGCLKTLSIRVGLRAAATSSDTARRLPPMFGIKKKRCYNHLMITLMPLA